MRISQREYYMRCATTEVVLGVGAPYALPHLGVPSSFVAGVVVLFFVAVAAIHFIRALCQ